MISQIFSKIVLILFFLILSLTDISFAQELATAKIISVPIAEVSFSNIAPTLQSTVNFSPNLVALEKIGFVAYSCKVPLIISSSVLASLTLTTLAMSNMFSDPIIITLPELITPPELIMLPKIPIQIQTHIFYQPAVFYHENTLLPEIPSQILSDLLAVDHRVGVNLGTIFQMPDRLDLYAANYCHFQNVNTPYLLHHFTATNGFQYDVFKIGVTNPSPEFIKATAFVTQHWVYQIADELPNLDPLLGKGILYNGEVALIQHGELNYTIYHQIDIVKPTLHESGIHFPEPLNTIFLKDYMPNTAENLNSAFTFFKEVKGSPN